MEPTYHNYIGAWRAARSGRTYQREDPSDYRSLLGAFADSSSADVDHAVAVAQENQPTWAATSAIARGRVLAAAADQLRARSEEIGAGLAREAGKTIAEATGEVARAADVFDYVAALGSRPDGSTFASAHAGAQISTVSRPLGVVAAITPFNFPAFVASFKVAAAIMAGNALIWKPSPLTPLTGIHVCETLLDAGLPSGVLNYVTGESTELGERLLTHPAVAAISFTGSTAVGRRVEVVAAQHGKRVQAEKGGQNPLLVYADGDLARAADAVVTGAFGGAGQKCTSTGRVIVEEQVADELTELVVARTQQLVLGSANQQEAGVGPLVSASALDRVAASAAQAVSEGATLLLGGGPPDDPALAHGYYFRPTVITDVTSEMGAAREEIFGPTVAIMRAAGRAEAITMANSTGYGLSAGVYTSSLAWAQRFVREVRAGTLNVNMPTTGVEPQAPFGGVKDSGSGPRELGPDALAFYLEQSTVTLNPGDAT